MHKSERYLTPAQVAWALAPAVRRLSPDVVGPRLDRDHANEFWFTIDREMHDAGHRPVEVVVRYLTTPDEEK